MLRRCPQAGHARDQKVERGQLVRGKKDQEGKKASGKMEKRKIQGKRNVLATLFSDPLVILVILVIRASALTGLQ